jgi:hypothetical protein
MSSTSVSAIDGTHVSVRSGGARWLRVRRDDHWLFVPRDIALEVADLLVDWVERGES